MITRSELAKSIYADTFHNVSQDDSDLWLDLFMLADVVDPDLAARLQYLRNAGTKLVKDAKWGYKLVPHVGPEGWQTVAEYQKEAECLKPYRSQLIMILKKLGE